MALFLRSVNSGGHTVKMVELKKYLEKIPDVSDVSTVLQAGNACFKTKPESIPGLERLITSKLEENLGWEARAFIRTPVQVSKISSRSTGS